MKAPACRTRCAPPRPGVSPFPCRAASTRSTPRPPPRCVCSNTCVSETRPNNTVDVGAGSKKLEQLSQNAGELGVLAAAPSDRSRAEPAFHSLRSGLDLGHDRRSVESVATLIGGGGHAVQLAMLLERPGKTAAEVRRTKITKCEGDA